MKISISSGPFTHAFEVPFHIRCIFVFFVFRKIHYFVFSTYF